MISQRGFFVNVDYSILYYLQILIDFHRKYSYTNKYEKIIVIGHGGAGLSVRDLV